MTKLTKEELDKRIRLLFGDLNVTYSPLTKYRIKQFLHDYTASIVPEKQFFMDELLGVIPKKTRYNQAIDTITNNTKELIG